MKNEASFAIEVEPRYLPEESDPAARRWVFAYAIRITNNGTLAATLRNRHWVITNADGQRQEVRGRGVVGEEPHIQPGVSFRYSSAAVLETPVGSMHGDYEFQVDGSGELLIVPIPVFSLSVPNLVH